MTAPGPPSTFGSATSVSFEQGARRPTIRLQAEPTAGGQRGRALKRAEVTLRRADRILDELPGTAYALTVSVLSELDALAQARHDGQGV